MNDRRAFIAGLAALACSAGLPSIAVHAKALVGANTATDPLQQFKDYCLTLNEAQLRVLGELLERLLALPTGESDREIVAEAIGRISALR